MGVDGVVSALIRIGDGGGVDIADMVAAQEHAEGVDKVEKGEALKFSLKKAIWGGLARWFGDDVEVKVGPGEEDVVGVEVVGVVAEGVVGG